MDGEEMINIMKRCGRKITDTTKKYKKRIIVSFLLYCCVYLLFVWVDPFNIITETHKYSKKITQAITSFFYSGENKHITSILVTEETLKREYVKETTWPITYSDHARILRIIHGMKPKAVYVDFSFIKKRNTDHSINSLENVVRLYNEKGI